MEMEKKESPFDHDTRSRSRSRKQLIQQLTSKVLWSSKCFERTMWKWESLLYFLLSAPIWGLLYCLIVAYASGHTTATHCRVPNFAMSVSEATSVPKSSGNVWLTSILSHIYSRIFHANVIFKAFMENTKYNNLIYFDW